MPASHSPEDIARAQAHVDRQFEIIIDYAMAALALGKKPEEIVDELLQKGVDIKTAEVCVRHSILKLNEKQRIQSQATLAPKEAFPAPAQQDNSRKEAAKLQMTIGAIAVGLGGLITFASYGMAEAGGKYILAYGAIIVGGWNLVSGWWKYANA